MKRSDKDFKIGMFRMPRVRDARKTFIYNKQEVLKQRQAERKQEWGGKVKINDRANDN